MDRHSLWIYMDNIKRSYVLRNELKRLILKSTRKAKTTSYVKRYQSAYHFSSLPRTSSSVMLSNRCVISGRVWGVTKKSQYSRFIFRNEAYSSNIPGCKRASW